jgi:hypothetical protein
LIRKVEKFVWSKREEKKRLRPRLSKMEDGERIDGWIKSV